MSLIGMAEHRLPEDVGLRLRREMVSAGQELARQQAVLALLRAELRSLRNGAGQQAVGRGSVARRLLIAARHRSIGLLRRALLSFAEYTATHPDGRVLKRLHPVLAAMFAKHGRRWPLRRLLPWLSGIGGAAGVAPPAPATARAIEQMEQDLGSTRRAVEHGHALTTLLRGEIRRLKGGRPVPTVGGVPEPQDLVRDGVVVPTDAMVRRLIGRVRINTAETGSRAGQKPKVTVAVRFHDLHEIETLRRSLYALRAQRGVELSVLVMYQGSDTAGIARVSEVADSTWQRRDRPRVISVPNPEGQDIRARLLNAALDIHYHETDDDFFFVLDHDDIVFSHALETLAGSILGGDAAVAFGKILVARYLAFDGYDFLYRMEDFFRSSSRDPAELMLDNFLPIHAYVYHTAAMPKGSLRFDESMDRLEDYECLYRVVATYPVSTLTADELVGLYCWKGSRAVAGPIAGSADGAEQWQRNRLLMARTMIATAWGPVGSP